MPKKSSRKNIIKNLDKIFSEYIRKRKADKNGISKCITCGKSDYWKNLQCGHFISRKQYSTRWDENNCEVQCSGCNVFKYGEQYKFGVYLDAHYGEGTANNLLVKSRKITKFSNIDLITMIEDYKKKVAEFDF